MKKLIFLAVFCTFGFCKDVCLKDKMKATVDALNKQAPMQIDRDTIFTGSICINDIFTYNYRINFEKDELTSEQIEKLETLMKEKVTNSFCSNENIRGFLNMLKGIEQNYYSKDSKFLFVLKTSKEDCR